MQQSRIIITVDHWRQIATALCLTPRELQIISHIITEQKDESIAQDLGISYNSLRAMLSRLYKKLGVHSRTGVVVVVFEEVIRRMGERMERNEP